MIRMNPWTTADVEKLAAARFQLPHCGVTAILRNGVLARLTQNPRLAWAVVDTAEEIYSADHGAKFHVFDVIQDRVPDIVRVAVDKFIDQSVLRRLDPVLRRRLAVWFLFHGFTSTI
jgi:hypothetical protein